MERIEALVTPSVMRWARKQAKLSFAEAAARIRRPIAEIQAWEAGSLRPSIAQARRASEVYRRPLAVLYLPEPPQDFETLRDFRSLPDTELRDYSPELALLIRTTLFRQEWLREHLLEENFDALQFVGSVSFTDSPRKIALNILNTLQLSPEEQRKSSTRQDALRLWIEKTEAVGIFVFRQGQIALEEARGFVISDDVAPFIYINSADSKAAQIFTLAHELAHLWLDLSGVSNLEPLGYTVDEETTKIEAFCNRVAAEAVLEEQAFSAEWSHQSPNVALEERVQQLSRVFKVSEEAIARRLLEKDIISQERYLELRQIYQERWQEIKSLERDRMKLAKGGPSYYLTTVAKNGYAFTQTVVSAFMTGTLSGRDASSLLNVKVNNLHRLGETAGIFTSAWEGGNG